MCKRLLEDKVKNGKHKQLGAKHQVPNSDELFDISKCKCFPKDMDPANIKLEGCSCPPRKNLKDS